MTKPRDPKSPYARYNKSPFKYSEHYQRWASAVAKSDLEEAAIADRAFRKAFNVPLFVGRTARMR